MGRTGLIIHIFEQEITRQMLEMLRISYIQTDCHAKNKYGAEKDW